MVFVIVFVVLGFFFTNKNSDQNISNKVDKGEKDVVNLLNENADIVEFLEKTIYSYDDEIFVKYEDSKIEFSINKKVKEVEAEQEELLVLMFTKLKCKSLSLRKEQYKKILEIFLGDVTLGKDNVYSHWLIYSKSKSEDFGNEVLPNWYYRTLFYT